jgi:ParB family chromosome partitioning protein
MTATLIRDIPLSKLVASEHNVRRTNTGAGAEQLAASILAHGLLQSLAVAPVRDADGGETGKYRVSGGGRRLAALKLLAKRRQIAKTYLVPCLVHTGDEEEASLAENVERELLHPADEFEAFQRLSERGSGVEEIAARFGVTAQVVRQRLRLAAVSPKLMQVYRQGELTLDQLMAFAVTEDHTRQEAVHDRLSWNREPRLIRRMLTETQVPADDRRAIYVGADAYEAAGGNIVRDLFADDGGGYFEDAALLDALVVERLEAIAAEVRAEGWKWIDVAIDFPHGHGLKRLRSQPVALSDDDTAALQSARDRCDALAAEYEGADEVPDEVEAEFSSLEADIEALEDRQHVFAPKDIAVAGTFVCLDGTGRPRVERGFLRQEDERAADDADLDAREAAPAGSQREPALSDALVRDLVAHRTLALRYELGEHQEVAMIALAHALACAVFESAEASPLSVRFPIEVVHAEAEDGDTLAERRIAERHAGWSARLGSGSTLWEAVAAFSATERTEFIAHCVGLAVAPTREGKVGRERGDGHAILAGAVRLDMRQYWRSTRSSYFDRVAKTQILDAVREGVSPEAARGISGLKKAEMAKAAEKLVASSDWLPEVLRAKQKEISQPLAAE